MSEFDENNEIMDEGAGNPQDDTVTAGEIKPDTEISEAVSDTENTGTAKNPVQDFNESAEASAEAQPENKNAPFLQKIEIEDDVRDEHTAVQNKGVKIFAFILVCAIVLSSVCAAGYYAGRSSVKKGVSVDLELESVPKDEDAKTPAQVYNDVNKSIVGISVYNTKGDVASASGVIYSEEGYIVTNDHIYAEIAAAEFMIHFYDGSERTASYLAGDTVSDLAVLKLDDARGIVPATFGNSAELYCGQPVVAVGRPNSATDDSSITSGIVSAAKRRVQTTTNYSANLIQTDSAINPGSSGGALVNMYSQVIGITSSKLAGVQYDSIGFAIPTTITKRVVEQLIKSGKVTDRAKLGITYTELNSVYAKVQDISTTGLLVVSVSNDSDLYGKVVKGDIITHINGTKITADDMVLDIIEESRAGDKINLTVLSQSGMSSDYTVKLKANVGESSYTLKITNNDESDSYGNSGGTFNFPFGE